MIKTLWVFLRRLTSPIIWCSQENLQNLYADKRKKHSSSNWRLQANVRLCRCQISWSTRSRLCVATQRRTTRSTISTWPVCGATRWSSSRTTSRSISSPKCSSSSPIPTSRIENTSGELSPRHSSLNMPIVSGLEVGIIHFLKIERVLKIKVAIDLEKKTFEIGIRLLYAYFLK